MKILRKPLLCAILFAAVLPGMLFSHIPAPRAVVAEPLPTPAVTTTQPATTPTKTEHPRLIPILNGDGTVTEMELEEYVCGVVLGEMPASFEPEALKAQAVAARTYALRCSADGVHPKNAVCKEHTCCQNYCDPEGYLRSGGKQKNLDKIRAAVEATAGQAVYYKDRPIFAAYFASSGGQTEDAVAVWGSNMPYLVSVTSEGEKDTAYQNYKMTFTPKVFQQKLGVTLTGSPTKWFGRVTYTAGGGVEKMVIGGKTYTGVKLRSLLGLRSTKFTVKATENTIVFTTEGYGHRVGMSQYGADAMAAAGKTYKEILAHYYSGTVIR